MEFSPARTVKRLCNRTTAQTLLLLTALALAPQQAMAYMGPGAGLGMIGSIIAVLVAAIVLIFGLLLYPIKVLMKRRALKKDDSE